MASSNSKLKERKSKGFHRCNKPPKLTTIYSEDIVVADFDDSGVHLDDPLTPRKASDAASESESKFEEDLFPGASSKHGHLSPFGSSMSQSDSTSSSVVVTQFHSKCTLTTHHSDIGRNIQTRVTEHKPVNVKTTIVTRTSAQSQPGDGKNWAMSPTDCEKSSSKMCQSDATNQKVKPARKSSEPIQSSSSNPVSPREKEEVKKSHFSFFLGEASTTTTSSTKSCSKGSAASKSSDPTVVDKTELRRLSSAQEKSSRKGRFKKILHPLRRSQSAGNTKDVPAHALFLRHHTEMEPSRRKSQEKEKKSAERSSAEPPSSNESSDEDSDKKHKDTKKKKSLAKDVKEKFSFLRRRHTDTSLHGKMGGEKAGSSKCTSDIARSWTKSFDTLLMDRHGLELFREFLRTEFSEENIEFWIACEEYKNTRSSKNLGPNARRIYTDFVAVQAPHEINLDSKTREATLDSLDHPNRHTFEAAQKRIQALMEKDSYPRFLRSNVYLDLISHSKS